MHTIYLPLSFTDEFWLFWDLKVNKFNKILEE